MARSVERCPHCKVGELTPTKKTHVDTSETTVQVFACSRCEYTEGRPVKS